MQERIQEKYNANKKPLFKKYFALHISPIFLAILFSFNFKCSFYDKFSSNRMPRNFIDDCLFITWLLTLSFPVPRWVGDNTDLPLAGNILKAVRKNIVFTECF